MSWSWWLSWMTRRATWWSWSWWWGSFMSGHDDSHQALPIMMISPKTGIPRKIPVVFWAWNIAKPHKFLIAPMNKNVMFERLLTIMISSHPNHIYLPEMVQVEICRKSLKKMVATRVFHTCSIHFPTQWTTWPSPLWVIFSPSLAAINPIFSPSFAMISPHRYPTQPICPWLSGVLSARWRSTQGSSPRISRSTAAGDRGVPAGDHGRCCQRSSNE